MKATGIPGRHRPDGTRKTRSRSRHVLAASAAVFAFWLVISASLARADLLLGAALSLLLGWWSACFLWAGHAPRISARQLFALLCYLLLFSGQVFLAAVHVARVVVDPRLPIRPKLITCRTKLRRDISRVAFANSVSLTPGTLTVDMDAADFLVHCLDEESARRILSGELERRVARVFEQEDDA
jgi:multicomponent Na+:H+ antiporter subunit E